MADTRFSSSFIPKTPVVGATMQKERMGVMTAIGGLIFLLSILSIAGAFTYKKMIESKITKLQTELSTLESQVNRQEIARLVSFDKKLDSTKQVLTNHVALTYFFKMLEKNTLSPVSFTSLRYSAPAGKNITITMDGFTTNYRTLREQEVALLADPSAVAVNFKTMTYDKTKRQTTFVLDGEFNKSLVKYAYANVASAATTTTTTTATTSAATASTTKVKN